MSVKINCKKTVHAEVTLYSRSLESRIDGLQDAVHTYAHTTLQPLLVSFCKGRDGEKNAWIFDSLHGRI